MSQQTRGSTHRAGIEDIHAVLLAGDELGPERLTEVPEFLLLAGAAVIGEVIMQCFGGLFRPRVGQYDSGRY
ncbi:hypothetical protein ABBQ38_012404 [Trebouxia sp. C0009 RCD-2024]